MRAFAIFVVLCVAAVAAKDEFCFEDVVGACKSTGKNKDAGECSAKYGAIDYVLGDLQTYVNTHISRSYEYLMMSTSFANYEKNRAGFEKVFRDLSDSKWNTAIELIKYITKRGGVMDFDKRKDLGAMPESYELYELESLAFALDSEKKLADDASNIHRESTGKDKDYHDPEISSYIEEEFSHQQASLIRKLTGYTSDLNKMLRGPDSSLALYLFDEYLSKS